MLQIIKAFVIIFYLEYIILSIIKHLWGALKSSILPVVHNRTLGVTALQYATLCSAVISWALPICDGFRALAAVSPGCLATVIKSHRTWISTLCFHPPAWCIANGGPQGSHLNPPSNGASAPVRAPRMRVPPKFSIKAVHATAQGSLLVSRWLSHI